MHFYPKLRWDLLVAALGEFQKSGALVTRRWSTQSAWKGTQLAREDSTRMVAAQLRLQQCWNMDRWMRDKATPTAPTGGIRNNAFQRPTPTDMTMQANHLFTNQADCNSSYYWLHRIQNGETSTASQYFEQDPRLIATFLQVNSSHRRTGSSCQFA